MTSEDTYQSDRTPCRIPVLVWIDANWFWVILNGVWFWCGIFLYEEVEGFTDEKSAEVMGGPVP